MRRRIKSVELSPEESGLCGCWRLVAVERSTIDLGLPADRRQTKVETGYYASSLTEADCPDSGLLEAIRGHWDAIENGTHHVRDVTFGEDACRVSKPVAARNRVTLCNLAIGLYNLLKQAGRMESPSLPAWRRSMKATDALRLVTR